MIPQGHFESLHRMVFAQPGRAIYAVMDGAMIDGLPDRLARAAPESACLFEGSLDPMLSAAAPWLVRLAPGSAATRMALHEGWNGHWGIVLATASAITHSKMLIRIAIALGVFALVLAAFGLTEPSLAAF